MGWVVPAIIAAKGIFDWASNKHKENAARDQSHKQYDDYYGSAYHTAVVNYIRDYWSKHGLQDRISPEMLDSLLKPPPFNPDDPRYKTPGAGGRLGGAFFDAIATHYAPKTKTSTRGTTVGSTEGTTDTPVARESPGPPVDQILGGGQPSAGVGSSSRAAPDATRNDPQSIFEGIFGAGDAPTPVNDPASPLNNVLRNNLRWNPTTHRYEYVAGGPPGAAPTQGL